MNKYILITLVLLLFVGQAQAAPTVLTWSNDVTNDINLKPMVSEGQTVELSVSVVDVSIHHWYRNGVDQNHNMATYSTSYDRWGDVAEITYSGTNAGESTKNITWKPTIVMARATSTAIPLDMTRSNEFVNATDGDIDIEKMLAAEMYLFIDGLGVFAYLFFVGIPIVIIYIRSGSVLVPGVAGIMIGVFTIAALPATYQTPAVIITIVSISAVIFKLYKGRVK